MTTRRRQFHVLLPHMQTQQRVEVLKEIAVERSRLIQALVALNRRHNALVAISVLPPEILIKISWDVLWERRQYRSKSPLKYSYRAFEQVCHDWREAVMSSPSIWSTMVNPSNDSYPWTVEILRRSRDAPIDKMDLSDVMRHKRRMLQLTIEHAARLKSLALSSRSLEADHFPEEESLTENQKVLDDFLITPASILKHLSVYWHLEHQGEVILPKSFFLDNFPSLSSLQLSCFPFTFPMNDIFSKLTELDVTFYSEAAAPTGPYIPSGSGWLEIVRDAPLLKKLGIKGAFGDYSASRYAPIPSVSSPTLLSVYLHSEGKFNDISVFLSHLSLRPDCSLNIRMEHVPEEAMTDIAIMSFLQSVERHAKNQRLSGHCVHKHNFFLRDTSVHLRKLCIACDSVEFELGISSQLGRLPTEIVPILGAICSDASSLTPYLDPDHIGDFMRPLGNVTDLLGLGYECAFGMLPYLTIPSETNAAHLFDSNSILLPNLSYIEFNKALDDRREPILPMLKECLASRKAAGKPISRIKIITYGAQSDEILSEDLRSLGVEDVIWVSDPPFNY